MNKQSKQRAKTNHLQKVLQIVRATEILLIALLLGILPYLLGKTIWDLLELLIVPIVLAAIAYLFNKAEREAESRTTNDVQQEASLQAYLDQMTTLLLERGLISPDDTSNPSTANVREVARARTLTVVRMLNGERKGLLVRFLYQSKLIVKGKPIIDLSGADLSYANLSGNDTGNNRDRTFMSYLSLHEAQLAGVNFANADLCEAKLSDANLAMADLTNANLTGSLLMFTDLRWATLTGANLSNANLTGANLSAATGVTQKQLAQASSIKGVTLPDNTKVE